MRWLAPIFLLFFSGCAPIATMMPAEPAPAPGGTVALSVFHNHNTGVNAPFPYLSLFWGDGQKEFGLISQLGTNIYAKVKLEKGLALRASVGLPGPWYGGALLYDIGPFTLAGRLAYGRVEWGNETQDLWLGIGSVTYWYQGFGIEAAVIVSENDWNPVFSVGYRAVVTNKE